ncbi:MarR family winged helix-turn-helix transcriptional regulator [Pelagibius sp. Alg239-R121]|uniref:MarR family winged helix-turn-helix transcriptional regulator n=1 Tax=Pelagibius sp. Alg239-R121 TaxID=2993448 RepID=UPI0024A78F6D|nr:MarR family transcriptional regulator [Pelagibius sp. Alg239-R121]
MTTHTAAGAVLTELILETFRLNGRLLAAGDHLTKDLGLTSARWQVVGAIEEAPLPVAQIARNMGLTRQAVQRVANVLADEGLVRFEENPNHRRAQLVRLTSEGKGALEQVNQRQIEWSNRHAKGLPVEEIEEALTVLRTFHQRLEADDP